jgi:hypothetical protein
MRIDTSNLEKIRTHEAWTETEKIFKFINHSERRLKNNLRITMEA